MTFKVGGVNMRYMKCHICGQLVEGGHFDGEGFSCFKHRDS